MGAQKSKKAAPDDYRIQVAAVTRKTAFAEPAKAPLSSSSAASASDAPRRGARNGKKGGSGRRPSRKKPVTRVSPAKPGARARSGSSHSMKSGRRGETKRDALARKQEMKARNKRVMNKLKWLSKTGNVKTARMRLADFVGGPDFEGNVPIGRGGCGFVRLVELRSDHKYYALKCVKKLRIVVENDIRHLENEKRCLEALRGGPFVVNLFGTFQDSRCVYFLMEYVVGGELFSQLHSRGRFAPDRAKFYAAEALTALEHCHSLNIVYRDLKPENILIDDEGHIKLTDFGFARSPDADGRCRTKIGTPHYLAPEMLKPSGDGGGGSGGYTLIVDWWAFAVFVFELLTGTTPFGTAHDSSYEIYTRIRKGKISWPRCLQPDAKSLLQAMLTPDPSARLCQPEAIRAHPWFASLDWAQVRDRRLVPPFVPGIGKVGDRTNFDDYEEKKMGNRVLTGPENDMFVMF